jgi:hypothetical protein
MPDPVTTIGFGALAAYLGKDGLQKLLGPTAEYLGEGLRDFAKRRAETIGRIFDNAAAKLGARIETPGTVPPKVLRAIVNEGSFSNDDLAVEYLGGIVASSRTEAGRDDRGARLAKVVDALSTYQLRAHYLIYSTVRALFANRGLHLDMAGRPKMQMFLPYSGYASAMEFSETELAQGASLLTHVFFGLYTDGLIEAPWQFGGQEHMVKLFATASDGGIICQPSAPGVELYLWAFGQVEKPLEYIFDTAFAPEVKGLAPSIPGAEATTP